MQQEIEVKFLNVNHDNIREKLLALDAVCEVPMRLMRRKMFDYPDSRFQKKHSRLRVRDEGNGRVFINFKSKNESNYSGEVETVVGSYEDMAQILELMGLVNYSTQESRRETWRYKDVEVVLDEWPWVATYVEIEGPTETAIQQAAIDLGFDWEDAEYGSVDTAYSAEYTNMTADDSIGHVPNVCFGAETPQFLMDRK